MSERDGRGWTPLEGDGAGDDPPAPAAPPGAPPTAPPAAPPGWQQPPPPGWQQPPPPGWQSPPGWQAPPPLPKGGNARTGPLPLHPMTVSDVLDGAFKLFKANARAVILATAAVVVPLQLLSSWLLRDQFDVGFLELFRDPTVAATFEEDQGSVGQLVVAMLTAVLGALVTPFVAGAVCRIVSASYLGSEMTAGEALRGAARRFPALLGAFILVHLLEGIGFLLCILPGLALMAMFTLVAPAIVGEDIGAVAGMRRSWRLVRRRFWPVLGISLLLGFIGNLLGQILATAPALLALVLGGSFAWLAVALSGVLGQLVTLPVVTIGATLLYFDARIRFEGLDLQLMAREAAGVRVGRGPA